MGDVFSIYVLFSPFEVIFQQVTDFPEEAQLFIIKNVMTNRNQTFL